MSDEIPLCPECGAPLLQRNERDGAGFVLRSKLLKIDERTGTVLGQCHKCRRWVPLPLQLLPRPTLILRT